jgi:large subunit ribosomal protein L44e
MEIAKEITTYCPKCNKHTAHTVKVISSKGQVRTLGKHTRRHEAMLKGYVGKVRGAKHSKKLGKHQVVLLACKVCKYTVERTLGDRTRKKLELITG